MSWLSCCAVILAFALGLPARAQSDEVPDLAAKQQQLAQRFERLELLAGRLAELSRGTQPQRAKLLREVITRSRQKDVPGNFVKVVQLLEKDRYSTALGGQDELHKELKQLLDLMLQEDRDRQIESERKRIARYLKNLKKLIRQQRSITARNEGGDSATDLAEDQKQLSEETAELGKEISKSEDSNDGEQTRTDQAGTQKSGDQKSEENSGSKGETPSGKGEQIPSSEDGSKPSQDGQPKNNQPSEGASPEGQPSEGKPGESQPSEGQPSEGQPSEGQPSEGQPSEGQ